MDQIDELDMYEAERRLQLYSEYRDASGLFGYFIETELRAYLANEVEVIPQESDGGVYFEVRLTDVWIYEAERLNRFVPDVVVYTSKDVHVQRLKEDK